MKKTYWFVVAALLLVTVSCGSEEFTLAGKIKNMPSQKYYLDELGVDKIVTLDSASSKEDGGFSIKGKTQEYKLYRIRFSMGKYILFTVKNDEPFIEADWNNLEEYRVNNSDASQSLKSFLASLRQHFKDIQSLDFVTKNIATKNNINKDSMLKEVQKDVDRMNKDFVEYVKRYADTTMHLPNATFAANILNPTIEGYFLKNFYSRLQQRFPNSALAKQYIDVNGKKFVDAAAPDTDKYVKKEDGKYTVIPKDAKPATSFSGNTPDGATISLAAYKGKWVLVDFWASWCAPCHKENPSVLAAYRQYNSKNFDILGVSLDDDKAAWQNAIKADGLAWAQISELNKWQSTIARQYGINSIPANVLINPDGLIIAKNLFGDALEKKLAEVLQ